MSRIRKQDTKGVILDKFHPQDAELLFRFNITKQRIVDLCNQTFEDDMFDKAKNYSSWHRALDGQEVYEGIVAELDNLLDAQIAHPKDYLPDTDPGDDLREWMGQIAKATWWHKTLELEMSRNSLNSWFSGRVTKTRPELVEKVTKWWARVKTAVMEAERYSAGKERSKRRDARDVMTWDTWVNDLLEDGVSVDEARARFIDEGLFLQENHLDIIDLANPDSPLSPIQPADSTRSFMRSDLEKSFDAMHGAGFPQAISKTPPEFDREPFIQERKWGDRRNEDCPKDLNTHLYDKWYRMRCEKFWDATNRKVDMTTEIVEVSIDGESWRAPNEIEKEGWAVGTRFFFEALHAGDDTSNSYTREVKEAEVQVRRARRAAIENRGSRSRRELDHAITEAERALDRARSNTHGQHG